MGPSGDFATPVERSWASDSLPGTGLDVQGFVGLFETFLLPFKGPVIIYRLGGGGRGGGAAEDVGLNKVKF